MTGLAHPRTFLLLDLDGTLLDPAPGIVGSVRHAMTALGRPVPADTDLTWVIGPPLRQSFAILLGREAPAPQVEQAVALYRAAYGAGGLFEATPYPGIHDALAALGHGGFRCILCTAKPTPFAERVVAHFGLAGHFEAIHGAALDGRFDDKGDLIAHILSTRGLDPRDGCMIGDRSHDTLAARRNGMASIGVTWGHGSRRELEENGAVLLCDRPADLPACVGALPPGPPA